MDFSKETSSTERSSVPEVLRFPNYSQIFKMLINTFVTRTIICEKSQDIKKNKIYHFPQRVRVVDHLIVDNTIGA